MVSYVIRYLLTASGYGRDGDGVLGLQMVQDFMRIFPALLADTKPLERAVDYMVESKLMEKEDVDGVEYLNLTPKADMLWRMLQSNSICLEFFRDATFLDFDDGELILTQELRDDALFSAMSGMIGKLTIIERRHVEMCRSQGATSLFVKRFGTKLLTRYLLGGVTTSAKFYFNRDGGIPAVVKESLRSNASEIAKNEHLLGNPPDDDPGNEI